MMDLITLKGTHRLPFYETRDKADHTEFKMHWRGAARVPRTREMPNGMVWAYGPERRGYTVEGNEFVRTLTVEVQRGPLMAEIAGLFQNNPDIHEQMQAPVIAGHAREGGVVGISGSTTSCWMKLVLPDGSTRGGSAEIEKFTDGRPTTITILADGVAIGFIGLDGSVASAEPVEVAS